MTILATAVVVGFAGILSLPAGSVKLHALLVVADLALVGAGIAAFTLPRAEPDLRRP